MAGILPRRDTEAIVDSGTSEGILRAAEELIGRDGYHNVTVDDIRRAAGVSRATFYFYFRNKLHLFIALANRVIDDLYRVAGERYPNDSAYERLVLANDAYLRLWYRERKIMGEVFALSFVEPEIGEMYRGNRHRFEARIRGHLERLLERGRLPASTNVPLTTMALSGMVELFAVRYSTWDDEASQFPYHEVLQAVSEIWYRTVYAAEPPSYPFEHHTLDASDALPAARAV